MDKVKRKFFGVETGGGLAELKDSKRYKAFHSEWGSPSLGEE